MTIKDLWGQLPDTSDVKPPIVHLKEQAMMLGQKTANIISADINTSTEDYENILVYTLLLIAPALDNYRYALLTVKHYRRGALYPVIIEDLETETKFECRNESEFLDNLEKILTSEHVRKVIKTLIVQSKATT